MFRAAAAEIAVLNPQHENQPELPPPRAPLFLHSSRLPHPPALRRALWHWFKLTVTGTYHLETALSKEQLVYLYEEVERVLEAAWVMRGR